MGRGLFGCNGLLAKALLFEQFPALGLRGNGDFFFFRRLWRCCGAALYGESFSLFLQCAKFAVAHAGGSLRRSVCTVNCAGNALLYLALCIFFGGFLPLLGGAFALRLGPHKCFAHKLLALCFNSGHRQLPYRPTGAYIPGSAVLRPRTYTAQRNSRTGHRVCRICQSTHSKGYRQNGSA